MSGMTVKVEFMVGTEIEEAIQEAKEKAIRWDVAYVDFEFNGVSVSVGQKCDVLNAMKEWKLLGGIKSKYGYVFN